MENPRTWTRAHNVLQRALERYKKLEDDHCNWTSREQAIVDALRQAGYLTEKALEEVGMAQDDDYDWGTDRY